MTVSGLTAEHVVPLRDYGARSSILTGAVMVSAAFAPWLGALLAGRVGGYDGAFIAIAIAIAIAG